MFLSASEYTGGAVEHRRTCSIEWFSTIGRCLSSCPAVSSGEGSHELSVDFPPVLHCLEDLHTHRLLRCFYIL